MEPVAIETLGGIRPSSNNFFRNIGSRIAEKNNDNRSFAFLKQRLSVAVEVRNAACILESISMWLALL